MRPRPSILIHANVAIVINKIEVGDITNVLCLPAMQRNVTRWVGLVGKYHPLLLPVESDEFGSDGCVPVQRVLRLLKLHALLLLRPLRAIVMHIKG